MNLNLLIKILNSKELENDFRLVREKIKQAIDSSPDSVTLEDAKEQVRKFGL